MKTTAQMLRALLGPTVLLALAACGGSSPGGEDLAGVPPPETGDARGALVKGPVQGAQVQLFALDDAGFATGPVLATLTTNAAGRFSFNRPAGSPALLAVTRGGSFVDESDPEPDAALKRRIVLTAEQGFESVLPAGSNTLVITPYTQSLLLRARRAAGGANFPAFYAAVSDLAEDAFGFDPSAVIPESPLSPAADASAAAKSYALLLGGAAYAIQAQSVALSRLPDYEGVLAFVNDFSDGRLDGRLDGQPVLLGDTPLPTSVSINEQAQRFRNNHFAAYADLALPQIDESALSGDLPVTNQPPRAVDDSFAATEDTALTVPAPGILANDIDSEGVALTAAIVTPPASGSLTLDPNGGFVYIPAADFSGSDSFSYRAGDTQLESEPATVSISVAAVNDAPLAQNQSATVAEDETLALDVDALLAGSSDPEGDALAVTAVGSATGGSVSLQGGVVQFTPSADFSGAASFTYTVSDGGNPPLSTTAQVSVTVTPVNDPPVAANDSAAVNEDGTLLLPAQLLLANDTDPDVGDGLVIVSVDNAENGSVNLAGSSVTFVPSPGFSGTASFSYTIRDTGLPPASATATVAVTVNPVNDPPVAANDAGFTTARNADLVVTAATLLANDRDPDGDALGITAVGNASHGTVRIEGGSVRFQPARDYSGPAGFDYTVSDGQGGSDIGRVSLTVTAANNPPVAVDDGGFSTDEDTSAVIAAAALLANDTDTDGDTLTIAAVGNASGGTVGIEGGNITFSPSANFFGTAGFDYTVSDGQGGGDTARVSVTVHPVNDAPAAVDDGGFTTTEDTDLVISAATLIANDSDIENDGLSITAVDSAVGGGVSIEGSEISFTPDADFSGAASFRYTLSDDGDPTASDTATVSITVTAVDDPPVLVQNQPATVDEGGSVIIVAALLETTDAESDASEIVYTIDAPAHGAVMVGGSVVTSFTQLQVNMNLVSYVHDGSESASDSFGFSVTDGLLSPDGGPFSFTLNVASTNDAPTVSVPDGVVQARLLGTTPLSGIVLDDPDASNGNLMLTLTADAGTVTLDDAVSGGLTPSGISGNGTASVVVNATLAAMQATLAAPGGIVFDDAAGHSGPVTVALALNDNGNTGGSPLTAQADYLLSLSTVDLSDTGGEDVTFLGAATDDQSGRQVRGIGDFNGDGIPDLAIAAPFATAPAGADAGRVFVVYGKPEGFDPSQSLAELDGGNGFAVNGSMPSPADQASGSRLGLSLAAAGDFNGDGLADLLIGAPGTDGADPSEGALPNAGKAYLIFGRSTQVAGGVIDVASLAPADGRVFEGAQESAFVGASVAGIGDFDGDGYDDILIGAHGVNAEQGAAYLVKGAAGTALPASVETAGTRFDGVSSSEQFGYEVAGIGDYNGDGLGDLAILARYARPVSEDVTGAVYVLYGRAGSLDGVSFGVLGPTDGFVIAGDPASGLPHSVAGVGDFNGDGRSDLAVGSLLGPESAAVHLIYGGQAVDGVLNLAGLAPDSGARFGGLEALDYLGVAVASAGDVDGDGLDDLLVGASSTDTAEDRVDGGASYLIFGRTTLLPADFSPADVDGSFGLRFDGKASNSQAGVSVDGARDINGDGFDDLLIGAFAANESYLIFGRDYRGVVDRYSEIDADLLLGSSTAEVLVGGRNAQTLDGQGGGDALRGGADDDELVFDPGVLRLDGGFGDDELRLPAGIVDLSAYNRTGGGRYQRLRQIERLRLDSTELKLDFDDLRRLAGPAHRVKVLGAPGDRVTSPSNWLLEPDPAVDEDGRFAVYRIGPVSLLVHEDVDASGINPVQGLDARRASDAPDQVDGDGTARRARVSGNGRYVVFESTSTNLVASPANPDGYSQIYRRDRVTGDTIMVTQFISDGGPQAGDGDSGFACVDYDGGRVAFITAAPNLHAGSPGQRKLLVADIDSGNVSLAALLSSVEAHEEFCALSDDGSRLVMLGEFSGPTGTTVAAVSLDVATGETRRASLTGEGQELCTVDAPCTAADISGDGRYLVFATAADHLDDTDGLSDIYLRDLQTGALQIVAPTGDGASARPSISSNGTRIAFESASASLVDSDDNGSVDIFVHDRGTGATARVNTGADGSAAGSTGIPTSDGADGLGDPRISGDGRFVVFASRQTELDASALDADTVFIKQLPATLSAGDATGAIQRVHRNRQGQFYDADPASIQASVSFDGGVIAFESDAGNVVVPPEDGNGARDVFTLGNPGFTVSALDSDDDGLPDADELVAGTHPSVPDTDGDGLDDGDEAGLGGDPLKADTDGDDVPDGIEAARGSTVDAADEVYHVSFSGSDGNDGKSWGTAWAGNANVEALFAAGGNAGGPPIYVLYEEGLVLPAPDFAAFARQFVLIGSVSASRVLPAYPPSTAFDGGGTQRVLNLVSPDGVALYNLGLQNGGGTIGGGLHLSPAPSEPCRLDLHSVRISGNRATESGGGIAVTGGPPDTCTLNVADSAIVGNTIGVNEPATSATILGAGIYATGGAELSLNNTLVGENLLLNLSGDAFGAGIAADGATQLSIDRSVIAANGLAGSTSGSGGGVWARNSSLSVSNSRLLSNFANNDGGAVKAEGPGGDIALRNNLVVGNGLFAPGNTGGAVSLSSSAGTAVFIANTVAFNQSVSQSTDLGAGVVFSGFGANDSFRNNTVWFNDNGSLLAEPGDNAVLQDVETISGNNLREGSFSLGDPLFVAGFYLDRNASPNLDKGDTTPNALLLDPPYTTAPDGAEDTGLVDVGFHYPGPSTGRGVRFDSALPADGSTLCTSAENFELRPLNAAGNPVGPGQRVTARYVGSASVDFLTLLTLDPIGDGSLLMRDLGDGRYQGRFEVPSPPTASADVIFEFRVNDQPLASQLVYTLSDCSSE